MSDECYTANVMISMFSPGFEVVKLGRYWLSGLTPSEELKEDAEESSYQIY